MRFNSLIIWVQLIAMLILLESCRKTDSLADFTEEDEIALGEKLADALASDEDFAIIPEDGNSIPYGYVNSRLNEITTTSLISKGEEFVWRIYLLDDDKRQAFAFPGGHLYISSGMIFFLDNEDQFSGLIAHLVAHVDQSHLTEALFFKYGVNGLKSIANSGGTAELKGIIDDLELSDDFLIFTRGNEIQADTLAISILAETEQSCESGKLFFSKTINVQADQQAEFITVHQLKASRIDDIEGFVSIKGCDAAVDNESGTRYRSFRNSLP